MYIKEKHNKGITLIALVITIIVLLILAGVSISLVVGNNGVLTQASNSVIKNREATAREEVTMAVAGCESDYWNDWATDSSKNINNYFSKQRLQGYVTGTIDNVTEPGADGSFTVDYTKDGVSYKFNVDGKRNVTVGGTIIAGETATGENKTYSDGTSTATIPKGWTVSGFSDEQTIANGLVIYDLGGVTVEWTDANKTTIQENYNQFVWVPVSLASTADSMPRYDGYYLNSDNESVRQTLVNVENPTCTEPYASGYSTEGSEYTAMINSVKANGGFYVGRYEASQNSSGTAESKKGTNRLPWTNIAWGTSMSNPGSDGAVGKAKAMYSSSSSVTSMLIYGCQWDAIMTWIDSNYADTTNGCVTLGTNKSILVDSSNIGYYNQSAKTSTGSNINYAVKNIYDMAGNVWEWTMEAYNTNSRVIRGGGYGYTGLSYPVSNRFSYYPSDSGDSIGFRVTLYL